MSGVQVLQVARGAPRRRWSAARAAEVLGEAERSGQELADFCRDRGLNYERLRRWRIRLHAASKSKRSPAFVPVRLVDRAPPHAPPAAESKVPGAVEFDLGGCVVRMRGEVSESMLVRALRAAKEAGRC